MKIVAVFFGGQSVEHDVSVITGVMTVNSINKQRFLPIPVYVDKKGDWYTGEQLKDLDNYKNIDYSKLNKVTLVSGSNKLYRIKKSRFKPIAPIAVAINCMHGGRGEDGSFSGVFKAHKIPLASPCVLPSAVSMDKNFTKTVMKGLGVKTLPSITVRSIKEIEQVKSQLEFPLIVKPNLLGSSIGVSTVKEEKELSQAVRFALSFGDSVMVEPCLEDFTEINCAAYLLPNGKIRVSECEEPVGRAKVLTFGDKYETGKRVFPAQIEAKLSKKIQAITERIYREIGFRGIIRIDYFIHGGKIYLNEINAVPGSLGYYLFSQTLKGFTEILDDLIVVAEKEFSISSTFTTEYKSGILNGVGSKGAKCL